MSLDTDHIRARAAPVRSAGARIGSVRATRLLYVENDPALRGMISRALKSSEGIDLLLETGIPEEVLNSPEVVRADAALLDLALGTDEVNGIDLGLALRERNPDIGIVVYSQYSLRNMARRVPEDQLMGWSFVPKSGDMDMDDLVAVIRTTAQGRSHDLAGEDGGVVERGVLGELSTRQRAVMALAATGLAAPEIARRLGATHDAVRKDLSKTYRLLVPGDDSGDLRTKAVLAYLQLMNTSSWDES